MSNLPILTITMLIPFFSSIFIIFFVSGKNSPNKQLYATYAAILSAVLTLICTIYLLFNYKNNVNNYQFIEQHNWFANIGLNYHLGVDGTSILMIALTALLTLICIINNTFTINKHVKEFLICILLLETFCIGAFCSLNLLLFYLLFEATLIPMFIIIGIWGGENKIYAALKYFLYTLFGSLFFLLGLIYLFTKTQSFDLTILPPITSHFDVYSQKWLWLSFFIAFAIKIPMFPLHTWLPDAHVQAPTSGSILLAGILLKLGAYGLLRISLPLFPNASVYFSQYVLILSAIAIIFASLVAIVQTDMKKMIAYSSIAHMGYVTGGIFSLNSIGIAGAVFQMISHGLISAALFLIVGVLYERSHTKNINMYGNIISTMPKLGLLFLIATLGAIALPGTSGFIGELLSLIGIFKANALYAALIAVGIILSAVYMLKLYKKIMLGSINNTAILKFKDLYNYELIALLPLIILIMYLGLIPNHTLKIINSSVQAISEQVNKVR